MEKYERKNGYVTIYKGDNEIIQNYGDRVVIKEEVLRDILKDKEEKEEEEKVVVEIKEEPEIKEEEEKIKKDIDKKKRK